MIRTQLLLDDDTYIALRIRAFKEHKSMSALARKMLREGLRLDRNPANSSSEEFSFIGSGASGRGDISIRHDDALAEDFM